MSTARERFGPPQDKMDELFHNLDHSKIRDAAQGLQKHGVTHDGAAQAAPAPKQATDNNNVRKDMSMAHGDRHALSPDGRNQQAQQAGQALKSAGVTGGQSVSAAKQFAPSHTPTQAPPTQSRTR